MAANIECSSLCPDPQDLVEEAGDILLPNPGQLYQLVASIRSASESGLSLFPTDGSLMRNSKPLSVDVPGWMRSYLDFEREGYPETKMQWFGRDEEGDRITSLTFVLGPSGQVDIMELTTMNQSGETFNPIPYLRGIPCTEDGEVVRVTNYPQPTEEQRRSLAELSIIPEVPQLIQTMLREVGPRTDYNAFRIVIPEISGEGVPFLSLKRYDARADLPSLRAAG